MFFDRFCIFAISLCILPACAGVNLVSFRSLAGVLYSPRMRGGQPSLIATSRNKMRFSPRARGSTLCRAFIGVSFKILPRMRGGQPIAADLGVNDHTFTPHARGSTFCRRTHETTQSILPARAGVNPYLFAFLVPDAVSPRMRGGQPVSFEPRPLRTQFSPHARGSTRRTIGTV